MPKLLPRLESLEGRVVPAHVFAVGSAPGVPALARLIDADTGGELVRVTPYGDGFTGGVRVAVADVTGDGVADLITAPGPGTGPVIRAFDATTGAAVAAGPLSTLVALDPAFRGGAFVAAGDVNLDGIADVVVGAGPGGAPVVSVIDGKTGSPIQSFLAYSADFTGGVSVAAGDVDGDGRADVVTAPGAGGGPHVRAFRIDPSAAAPAELLSFFAYPADFRGGAAVAAGDVDADGVTDVVTGAGPGGGAVVGVFRGSDGAQTNSFFAGDPAGRAGVHVTVTDGNGGSVIGAAVPATTGQLFTATGDVVGLADDLLAGPAVAADNPALLWNEVALAAIRADNTAPPKAARALAIVHTAVFDAVNAVTPRYKAYYYGTPAPAGTDPRAAALAAGATALAALFPAQKATFEKVLAAQLQLLGNPRGKELGVAVGTAAAQDILAFRQADGSATPGTFTPGSGPGQWVPTPPANAAYALPNWGKVTPFAIPSLAGFQPPGPPPIDSPAYTAAFNQVKDLGRADSTTRTAEQTQIAIFWRAGAGTVTPPGMSNVIAEQVVRREKLDLLDAARVFALVNLATADAGVVAWDAKLTSAWWRPVTAIRTADTDGNPDTAPDATWSPLIPTPNHPDYVSGHSAFSGAAAAVLEGLFGTDYPFRMFSPDVPGVSRSFVGFRAAAEEAGMSRIYGGIHTMYATRDGLAAGRAIGEYVVGNLLKPV